MAIFNSYVKLPEGRMFHKSAGMNIQENKLGWAADNVGFIRKESGGIPAHL